MTSSPVSLKTDHNLTNQISSENSRISNTLVRQRVPTKRDQHSQSAQLRPQGLRVTGLGHLEARQLPGNTDHKLQLPILRIRNGSKMYLKTSRE